VVGLAQATLTAASEAAKSQTSNRRDRVPDSLFMVMPPISKVNQ
jgi:hypothetical protein